MIFSLPSYRRLSEADLDRLRKDSDENISNRVSRALFNILLLAGLWGLPFYLRSLVQPEASDTIDPSKAIVGRWQSRAQKSLALEFTRNGDFRLSRQGIVKLTAHYHFDKRDEVVLYDFNPPRIIIIDHAEDTVAQYRFTISFTEAGLTATTAPPEAARSLRELQWNRLGLPPPFGSIAHFKRVQ